MRGSLKDYLVFLQVFTTLQSVGAGAGLCEQAVRVATAKTVARNMCFIEAAISSTFSPAIQVQIEKECG